MSPLPAVVGDATGASRREVPAARLAPPVALPRPSPCKPCRRRPGCPAFPLRNTRVPPRGGRRRPRPGLAWPALPVAVACAAAGGRGESVERAYASVPSKRCGVPVSFEGTSQREEPRRIDPPPAKRDRSIFSTLRGLFVLNKLRTAERCLSCGYLSCVLRRSVPTCFGHGLQFC